MWSVGLAAMMASGLASAATITLTFPQVDGPDLPFGPYSPAIVGVPQTFTIPPGERIMAATASGKWGSTAYPYGTAGVNVYVDDVLVAKCIADQSDCYVYNAVGERSWSHQFTDNELERLSDGAVTMTQLQTTGNIVRLGASSLVIETGVPPVPALSPAGLGALLALMLGTGALLLRRRARS
jgi:hypothetical protein